MALKIYQRSVRLQGLVATLLSFVILFQQRDTAFLQMARLDGQTVHCRQELLLVALNRFLEAARSRHNLRKHVLLLNVSMELLLGDARTATLLQMLDHVACSRENAGTARTEHVLVSGMSLHWVSAHVRPSCTSVLGPYLTAMRLATAHALEVNATKLAHNMLGSLVSSLHILLDERGHHVHLVREEVFPVVTVDFAFLTVEVIWLADLVSDHVFDAVESMLAVGIAASDRLVLEGPALLLLRRDGDTRVGRAEGAHGGQRTAYWCGV